jgi:hypothetical protein
MVFHPQMDGLLERKNQWIEQYLRLVTSAVPKDWTQWLALASAIHNNQRNATMGLLPNQILLGYEITLNPGNTPLTPNKLAEECHHVMMEWRVQAIEAINQSSCREGGKTWSAVHCGNASVAQREEPKAPISIDQVDAKEIWTI